MIEVVPLDARIPRAWGLMPIVLDRLVAFAREEEPDENPEELRWRVQQSFAANDYAYRLLAVLNDGAVVGHALLAVEERAGNRWLTIQQYALDKHSGVTREIVDFWMNAFCDLARELKAKQLRARVKGEARLRAFGRYGLKPFAVLVARDVEKENGRNDTN
jgi:hypothetical protein